MKKKILLISSMLVTFILVVFVSLNNTNSENKNVLSNTNKDTEVINSNMITMMYETDAGTGIYEETKDTTWPENGYIFNENLSGCERGGELEYNSINKTVNLLSNKSDNCYVYFDKYDGVWIDNVSISNVTGSSVTLDISATSENGNITTYYYSLNDSEEYQETTTNPITINDLNKLTEYKISIYVVDSTNARSNIYEVIVTTTDESRPVINSVSVSNVTYNSFTLTVNATSDVGIDRYYYIIESENIAGTSVSNSYTFDNLEGNKNYSINIFVENDSKLFSSIFTLNVRTLEVPYLYNYIKSLYTSQGANGLYYHTSSLANSAGDNSYRYSGANPNNYVCFGSDTSPCPSDNLYRIIGVFGNEVKLIKNSSIGEYEWHSTTPSNGWSFANLKSTLNGTFLSDLGSGNIGLAWSDLISSHEWQIGEVTLDNIYTYGAKTAFDAEVTAYLNSTSWRESWTGKIGLMYVSDYYYAATNTYWTYPGYDSGRQDYRQATGNNWLFYGEEWTIRKTDKNIIIYINSNGYISSSSAYGTSATRPCFYLNTNVIYYSGTGTESDPYRLSVA